MKTGSNIPRIGGIHLCSAIPRGNVLIGSGVLVHLGAEIVAELYREDPNQEQMRRGLWTIAPVANQALQPDHSGKPRS